MLNKLFRSTPKWQSPKSQKRIEALAELNPAAEKELQVLLRLARDDGEPAVRREAVKYLADLDVLAQIQKRDLDATVRESATARLQDLISGRSASALSFGQRLAGIRRIGTPSMLVRIVREADHIDLQLAAIAQLNDEMFLDDIARHSSIARLRLAAAERIATPALLEALAEASRPKDKNVYKAVRARLDASHQQEKNARALQEKRQALCAAMEHHAGAALNPLYTAKAESLRQQWQEARGPEDAGLAERFETAFALAWQQINEVALAAQREADAAQAGEEMQQAVATLEGTLAAYLGQEDFDLPALAALRKTQRLRWELATRLQAPAPALARRHAHVDERLEQLEQMLVQWRQDHPHVAATLARLPQTEGEEREQNLRALQQTLAVYAAFRLPLPAPLTQIPAGGQAAAGKPGNAGDNAGHLKDFRAQLDSLAAGIRAGNTRAAGRQLHRAREFARAHHLHDARLGELAEALRELKSWAGFAVQPKKEELIARMQALGAHAMDPDDRADAVHALQEEWKTLGVADPAVEQPMWERFKAAGDAAFEPCRAHFAAQREQRAASLEKRSALCRQLEAYQAGLAGLADAAIDWKKHEAILGAARKEWQQCPPGDRHRTRPVQERFQRALDALEQRLHDVRQRHEAEKRRVVARTRELLTAADLRAACDEARRLQQEWKSIGQAPARVDHKLWLAFRAACDALFARREEEFKTRQAERDASLQQAEELIAALEKRATESAQDSAAEASRLETAFAALELPREKAQALRQRFGKARRQLEESRRQQAAAAREEKREGVVRAWEGRAAETAAAQKAEQLLLDLEILLELPSPEALQDTRRERQMQRLQLQGLRRNDAEARQLLTELLQTPPAKSGNLPEMAARLRQVLEKAER
ncbi:MAG: DUF349 domain-containing protein [Pseudomonadota bacterium]